MLWASIVGELHVLVAALIMLVLLPAWAVSGWQSGGLRASVLAVGAAFWIVVVTVLAYVSSVRYSLLFVIALMGLVVARRYAPKSQERNSGDAEHLRLWDAFEHPGVALGHMAGGAQRFVGVSWGRFKAQYGAVGMILTILALLWALAYGSWPWLEQVGPGTPDGYTNLLRIASLTSNSGVYSSGVSPTGVGALGALLSTAFFLPPLNVLRFLYPLADIFTVLASGMLSRQLTQSGRASALVMFLVSVSSLAHLGFPVNFESPLAMHWADILVLLAWAEAVAWSQSRAKAHIFFAALCILGASLTSPPQAAVGLVVLMALTMGDGWVVAGWGTLAGILGLVPLGLGVLTGHLLSPDGWLQSGFPAVAPIWQSLKSASYWLPWMAVILAIVNSLRTSTRVRQRFSWAVGGLGVATALFGWNVLVSSVVLWSGLMGLMVLIAGVDVLLVSGLGQMRARYGLDIGIAGVAVLGLLVPAHTPALHQYDPPLAAEATLKIEQALPPYEWTIVSPVNQYSEVLGRGWQEELSLFVQTYSLRDARSSFYQLKNDPRAPILTPNVFLLVEPRLYPSNVAVSPKDLSLPIATGNATYRGSSLSAVESRAYYWAMAYHRSHPRTSSIYMHSRNLMVLWIRQ